MSANPSPLSVSCIISLHREGILAHTTLHSIARARALAEAEGIRVQCVITLDNHDALTERVVAAHPLIRDGDIVDIVRYSDAGLSRNHAIARSSGEYIIIADGDDYCSNNFIAEFTRGAAQHPACVLYPEYLVNFGMCWELLKMGGPEDRRESLYGLCSDNFYSSRLAGHRSIFARIPFAKCDSGFGYEDWHWVCEAVAAGVELRTATGVFLFYRRRAGSRVMVHSQQKTVIPPSVFFEMLPPPAEPLPDVPPPAVAQLTRKAFAKEALLACLKFLPERLAASVFAKLKAAIVGRHRTAYPPFLQKALLEVAAVDGTLHPEMLPPIAFVTPQYDTLSGKVYAALWHALGGQRFDMVYLAGHIGVGGADLMAINYMESMVRAGKSVLCILTEHADRVWGRIPDSVTVLRFGWHARCLRHPQKQLVLVRLLLQIAPAVIHAVNDWITFEVISTYGQALKKQSKLCASIFADIQDVQDIHYGAGTQYLRGLMEHGTTIVTDNMVTAKEWHTRLGVPLEYFYPVYGLACVSHLPREEGETRRILWAGRLDKGKRLDILLAIAQALPDVSFEVHGQRVLDKDNDIAELSRRANVKLCGGYNDFYKLSLSQYAALIFTTQSEGLPNVLLEAAACGLPLIAPDRGGIADFVSEETGWLIASHTDVDAYVCAIRAVLADPAEAARRAQRAQRVLERRHTREAFTASLMQAYGFSSCDQR